MAIKKLTKAEAEWLSQFKELMAACPSKRLGSYTVGDADIKIYDKPAFDAYRKDLEKKVRDMPDDVTMHADIGSVLDTIQMPFQVDGVCG
ncbi:hypothetical protein [Janthinobacterium sp. CAN_S7]|uniref:hypothetical protein n=1 Tax=Janthinobacterium sp. CAN_S7 TaxID=3071704 RepID=UPI00319EA700